MDVWTILSLIALLCACLLPLTTAEFTQTDFSNMTRRQVLNHLLNNSAMDPRIPPDFDKDVPTNVTLQMHIVSFHSVNEVSMDFTMTFYLRRKWEDERLAFPTFRGSEVLELDTRLIDNLWIPDIFFRNEKSAVVHNVTVPNRLIHLFRNGTVLFSSRLSMTLSCPMDLLLFPLDVQACPVIIQSYAYSTSNVVFRWTTDGHSISKSADWEMAHFMDHGIETLECPDVFDHQFACVMAIFRLQRHLGYFLVHVYLPTVLVVILSWVSFWIDVGATPARVTIGVMSVLTMATQSSSVQTVLPRVSYVKAIDVWMAVCMAFVFAALLEYAYVNVLNRRKNVLAAAAFRKRAQGGQVSDNPQGGSADGTRDGASSPPKVLTPDPRRVDKIARCVFPSLFTLFTVTYCTVYGLLFRFQPTHRSVPV